MAELSPGAQAVLDALNMDKLNGLQQVLARAHAVAVLRAAAETLTNVYTITSSNNWGRDWIEGGMSAAAGLLAVANELECEQ